ncbi:MAG: AAA family ATPase [Candidatus Paceibacterota bacterium]|jgi:dephospho-CoA kinase
MIIGITGMNGSGKTAVADYLVSNYGFLHFSGRKFLAEKITEANESEHRGLSLEDRESFRVFANELRKKNNSPAYLVEQLVKRAQTMNVNAIIESIRVPGEIEITRNKFPFVVFAVDAEPHLRYERAVKRGSPIDSVSYEKFIDQEEQEAASNDIYEQNLRMCVDLADQKFMNNGTLDDLRLQIDTAMEKYGVTKL